MQHHLSSILLLLFPSLASAAQGDILWRDDFSGTALNTNDNWSYDLGAGGWGNSELQTYTTEAVSVSGGLLNIRADRRVTGFTSGRIKTDDKMRFRYGTVEARIKIPDVNEGLWPAFWTLGFNYDFVGWPRSGEIDIMEMGQGLAITEDAVNRRVISGAHWERNDKLAAYATWKTFNIDLNDDFHIYKLEWTPNSLVTFVDNVKVWEMDIGDANCLDCEEFHRPHFLLLNLAVGGYFTSTGGSDSSSAAGSSSSSGCSSSSSSSAADSSSGGCGQPRIDVSAPLPADMQVDWIQIVDNGYAQVFRDDDPVPTSVPTELEIGLMTTESPTKRPTPSPTPSAVSTKRPTLNPPPSAISRKAPPSPRPTYGVSTKYPTRRPIGGGVSTRTPTKRPSGGVSTKVPTKRPTPSPGTTPTSTPSQSPSQDPTVTIGTPTLSLSPSITGATPIPSLAPSQSPSARPSEQPEPSSSPSQSPSGATPEPSATPSKQPTTTPLVTTPMPSPQPSAAPSAASACDAQNSPITYRSANCDNGSQPGYQICLEFLNMPCQDVEIFDRAIAFWESVITSDFSDHVVPTQFLNDNSFCGPGFNPPTPTDDLFICGQFDTIDGTGNVLGTGTSVNDGSGIPKPILWGVLKLDSADQSRLQNDPTLYYDVVLHEIGHVIGIGNNWRLANAPLVNGACEYTGAAATAVYRALSLCTTAFPLAECTNGHWSEACFDEEFMTPSRDFGGVLISEMTIASLEDMGYTTDRNAIAYDFILFDIDQSCRCNRRNLRSSESASEAELDSVPSWMNGSAPSVATRGLQKTVTSQMVEKAWSFVPPVDPVVPAGLNMKIGTTSTVIFWMLDDNEFYEVSVW